MRLLLIVQNFPPERGAVRYTKQLARGMALRGHQVTVITGLPHYPTGIPYKGFGRWKPIIREEDGIRVIRTPLIMASNRQMIRRVLGFISFLFSALPWALFSPRPDAVIASGPPMPVFVAGLICSKPRRRPLILLLRDVEPVRSLALRKMSDHVLSRTLISVAMWLYRRADRVVVVHEEERRLLMQHGLRADLIETIPHGIDVDAFVAHSTRRCSFTIPKIMGRSVALYAGTIGRCHGLAALVDSATSEKIRQLPIDFLILGDGECAKECRDAIERENLDSVRILPPVSLESVPSVLIQADILVSSHADWSGALVGSKFIEYCAAGKPILVHGRSEAAGLVERIGNGLACVAGDRDRLFEVLCEFSTKRDEWARRALSGRQYARENFSQRSRDDQWETLLMSVASGDRMKKHNAA